MRFNLDSHEDLPEANKPHSENKLKNVTKMTTLGIVMPTMAWAPL